MAEGKETPKKPEEILKDVLEIVDIPAEQKEKLNSGVYEVDEVKDSFHETFIAKKMALSDEDIRKNIIGEFARKTTAHLQKGFDLTNEDIKDKKIEEVFDIGMESQAKKVDALNEQIKSPTEGVEQIKKLEEELKVSLEKTTTAIGETQKANQQLEEKQTQFDNDMKQSKINMLVNNELGTLKFRDDITDIEKKGFNSTITEKYTFGLDDNDKLTVTDTDGNQVQNEKKSEFLTANEVLSLEATTNKLIKQNNTAPGTPPNGQPKPNNGVSFDAFGGDKNNNGVQQPVQKGPRLHKAAIANTETLESASQSS